MAQAGPHQRVDLRIGDRQRPPKLVARRSNELVARRGVPVELRAQSYYLLGNLEFLRREYDAAVKGYDGALALIPGDDAPEALQVGRDAAHNRALALRLRKENEPPPESPDAGRENEPGDGGSPPEEPPSGDGGAGQPQDRDDDDEQQGEQDPKDQQQGDQQQDDQSQREAPSPDSEPQPNDDPGKRQAPPPPQSLSLSQDEKVLDQLERAPTVQQEAARAQRGRVRRVVEDK